MSKLVRGILCILAVLVAGACASSGARSGGSPAGRDVLTAEQIAKARATNAYEAVQRLRSNWMRMRGTTQMPGTLQVQENPVRVYLDDQLLGNLEQLHRIEIGMVEYIRHFSPAEATARWGFNHGAGAIYVSTRPM